MVNLDQMKLLEDKVGKAVSLIRSLSYEKSALKKELEEKKQAHFGIGKFDSCF